MYETSERPDLADPVLLVAFDGWIDAGSAGTAALDWIAGDRTPFVRFDADQLFDYRDQRPMHELREGVIEAFDWPGITMTAVNVDGREATVLHSGDWVEVSAGERRVKFLSLGQHRYLDRVIVVRVVRRMLESPEELARVGINRDGAVGLDVDDRGRQGQIPVQ